MYWLIQGRKGFLKQKQKVLTIQEGIQEMTSKIKKSVDL